MTIFTINCINCGFPITDWLQVHAGSRKIRGIAYCEKCHEQVFKNLTDLHKEELRTFGKQREADIEKANA